MSGRDDEIVSMQFDNKQFESGVKTSMSTLDKLKAALSFDGVKSGLSNLSKAVQDVSVGSLGDDVDGVSSRFSALSIVALGALANIGAKAADMGLQLAKSITIDPVMDGFREYETQMNSIQTILANTQRYGTKLPEVTANLNELNEYADKTIYNFTDMTKNIGLFTNAGIEVGDATSMIKGFSNAAAASGTSSQGAAGAAYQLSQALSAGTIRLMDWRSLTNVGMGNKNMQDGLIDIASAMGQFNSETTSAEAAAKDFNGSLESQWLSADVMSTYLQIMAGDMDAAAMASLGLSDAQVQAFQQAQVTAEEAATKVRTWTQLVGTLQEAVGSSWTESFNLVIGDFEEATELFTNISDTLGGVIGKVGDARNAMIKNFVDLGGRQDLIDIGANIWASLSNVVKPIQQAWEKIFPAGDGSGLKAITGGVKTFTDLLKNLTAGLVKLQPIFEAVFGVLKLGWTIVIGVVNVFTSLLQIFSGVGTGGILGFVGSFGALINKMVLFVNEGRYIERFFASIQGTLGRITAPMANFGKALGVAFGFLTKGDTAGFSTALKASFATLTPLIDLFKDRFADLQNLIPALQGKFSALGDGATGVWKKIVDGASVALGYIQSFLSGVQGVYSILAKGDFVGASGTFGLEEDSAVVAFLLSVRDALTGISSAGESVASVVQNITARSTDASNAAAPVVSWWEKLTALFSAIKTEVQPVIDKLGAAFSWIGSVVKRFVDDISGGDAVALANTGIFMMLYLSARQFFKNFADMFKAGKETFENLGGVFEQLTDNLKLMQTEVKSNIILKIAIALGILAASIWLLASIPPAQLAMSVGTLVTLMVALNKTMTGLTDAVKEVDTGKLIAMSVSMILLAGAMLLLALALKAFGSMDPVEAAIGLAIMSASLYALTTTLGSMSKFEGEVLKAAFSMGVIAGAMLLFYAAIRLFATLDFATFAEGMGYITATLAVLVAALNKMPTDSVLKNAAAIAVISASLIILAGAIKLFAAMGLETVAVGLGSIAATLIVLAIALRLMQNAMGGATALVVASVGIMLLAQAIKTISEIPMESLLKSLVVLFGAILLFAGVAMLITPIIPVMIALGIALGLIGAAFFLAGSGMLMFASGLALLATVGAAGGYAITQALTVIAGAIPMLMQQVGLGFRAFAVVISESGPEIVAALETHIDSLITAVINLLPKVEELFNELIDLILDVLVLNVPKIVDAGAEIIIALVEGLAQRIPELVAAVGDLITSFLDELANQSANVIESGTNLVITLIEGIGAASADIADSALETLATFLESLETSIRSNSARINEAGIGIADAIIDGVVSGITGGLRRVISSVTSLGTSALNGLKNILGIHSPSREFKKIGEYAQEGFLNGLQGDKDDVANAYKSMKDGLKDLMDSTKEDVESATEKLQKLREAREQDADAINKATAALAEAQSENQKANAAYETLTKNLVKQKNQLSSLAGQYEVVTAKLEEAQQALSDAIQTRDDYRASITDSYSGLGTISAETKLTDYVDELKSQIEDTKAFSSAIQTLRDLGLNDKMYKELLTKGIDALPFVAQLLEGGKDSVVAVNELADELDSTATKLGSSTSVALYQAGVDAAQGIVDGLTAQEGKISAQMEKIANSMVTAIKNKLGIHSPSRVFAEVAKFSIAGLNSGFKDSMVSAEKSAEDVGNNVVEALKKTLSDGTDNLNAGFDLNPTITPILDLSNVEKSAGEIDALLAPGNLAMSSAYSKAAVVSASYQSNRDGALADDVSSVGTGITYIQNNNSPKALSSSEIYRQTKNQLSVTKGGLPS